MAEARERLLRSLEELTESELRTFAFYLGPTVPRGKLEPLTPVGLAELLVRYCPDTAVEVAAQSLGKVPRKDLLPFLLRRGQREDEGAKGGPSDGAAGGETPRMEEPPAAAPVQSRRVSDQDLMKLARKMGKRWKQIGIEYLGIENAVLEQIEEENPNNVVMRAFYMLRNWRNHERKGATAARLYHILDQEGVQLDCDAYAFLLESA